jgi:hypothetical protein
MALNIKCYYAECRYAECHYAECFYGQCRGAASNTKAYFVNF